jgi:hypothetical protein
MEREQETRSEEEREEVMGWKFPRTREAIKQSRKSSKALRADRKRVKQTKKLQKKMGLK